MDVHTYTCTPQSHFHSYPDFSTLRRAFFISAFFPHFKAQPQVLAESMLVLAAVMSRRP